MDYRVELDVYNGPLDLLLYLIKRDELDIYDIPISRITKSYMGYITMLQGLSDKGGLDINVAGEFLVMAATLMEIKSALLLPRLTENPADPNAPTTEDLTDPRYELVQKLLEYKRFKDSAMLLEQKAAIHAQRFPRYPARLDVPSDEPPPLDMEEVQIWDLLEAFNRLMQEVGNRKTVHEVIYDDTPIDLHAADIEDRLMRDGKLTLRQLILERKTKSEMIGVFLAILELTRQKKILVTQTDAHDDIEILAAPEEHRRTYQEAMMAEDPPKPADDAAGESADAAQGTLFPEEDDKEEEQEGQGEEDEAADGDEDPDDDGDADEDSDDSDDEEDEYDEEDEDEYDDEDGEDDFEDDEDESEESDEEGDSGSDDSPKTDPDRP
jgi:segregation and condensation protein A